VSLPTTTTQLARTPKKVKLSAAARPSAVMKRFRGLLRLRQSKPHARRRITSQAQRPGRAQWRTGARGPPPTTAIQLARTSKKTKPSAAIRPSAAVKGVSGSLLAATLQLDHSLQKPSAATTPSAAERGCPLTATATNAQPKQGQTQRDLPPARQRDVSFAMIFPRIRALRAWLSDKQKN
jgi:hypothetical protein